MMTINKNNAQKAVDSSGPSSKPRIYSRQEHNVSRRYIDRDALKIMYRLIRAGHEAYLVGGGVRDLVLGKQPKDFDIATDARPNQIRSLFRNSRIIGKRFKLAHIYFRNNKIIEVATFRSEDPEDQNASQDGENLLVRRDNIYGTAATDAIRRDLTFNGLFYDLSTFSIIDYVGGVEDLKNQVTKMIGDPDLRFAEDPVRMMRCVRHSARTSFPIEPNTYNSILRNKELLKKSSSMRVYEELMKDLKSGYAYEILNLLAETGLLEILLPGLLSHNKSMLREATDFAHCLRVADNHIRNNQEISTTVMLSIIGLFIGERDFALHELPARFETKAEIKTHLSECFPSLAVPKKERERLEDLLWAWLQTVRTPKEELKKIGLASKPYLPVLITLYSIINCELEDKKSDLAKENLSKLQALQNIEYRRSNQRINTRRDEPPPRRNRMPGGRARM